MHSNPIKQNKLSEVNRQEDPQRASKNHLGKGLSYSTLNESSLNFKSVNASYLTPDLMFSAFLKAKGLKLLGVKRNNFKTFFEFEESEDRPALTRSFFNNGAIGIGDFKSHLNDLKILLNQRG